MTDVDTIRALPCWQGLIEVEPLGGGLSNRNFLVRDGGRQFVARMGMDMPFHHVFRAREAAVSQAAAVAGISPKLVHVLPGTMIFDYIGGQVLTPEDVRHHATAIARLLWEAHHRIGQHLRGPASYFCVFHVIRDYAARLTEADVAPSSLNHWLEVASKAQQLQPPLHLVIGHNDLLPANILRDPEGRLWLIDWEYGGYASPLFDLANLAGNAGFSDDEERQLLEVYFGTSPDADLLAALRAMKLASLLRETLWGMVSALCMPDNGVDYAAYTRQTRAAFETVLDAFEGRAA
ncbi:thiamine kinase [Hartmannibacter diazotrophicus]|uniref:Thiamine kinase n=1 Tax=Hartmannibacter diazotrophicus TaxID=1482074 RepID=A0A2C9DD98_9HYPH|nr:choline/ethanolamine kinase family protein [Hartmannibacter diazotrophicus]SON58277.1 thiamine kinase [Hartmannibacter diazotrophicus]